MEKTFLMFANQHGPWAAISLVAVTGFGIKSGPDYSATDPEFAANKDAYITFYTVEYLSGLLAPKLVVTYTPAGGTLEIRRDAWTTIPLTVVNCPSGTYRYTIRHLTTDVSVFSSLIIPATSGANKVFTLAFVAPNADGTYRLDLECLLATGHYQTIAGGTLSIVADATRPDNWTA